MASCPFCKTDINNGAIICTGCGAQYGYYAKQGKIYDKNQMVFWGIKFPVIMIAILLFFLLITVGTENFEGMIFFSVLVGWMPVLGIIMSRRAIKRGPIWFAKSI